MEVLFSDVFVKSLKKHSSIKKVIQKKVDMIIENPIVLGEPLKGNFRGYYSSPAKKNFLIIYLYCKACRDETIKFVDIGPHFVDIGPHDEAYKKKSYWS